ncbi:TRPC2 protein, partial [Nyctiprogne leucopyga]|nr:TRPC2 protein [Nyctiprogne leucopyga]
AQDPRYPVENLLREDGLHPWLSCPQDHSRQLRVELQLERASPIGYVDVGNCGCAFLQIEVGRSSWPLDRPYLTLVPSVALMTPADSKLDRNRCAVRMFKEADFLALAVGQKWDRLRLSCSQPFSRRGQFGLSFLRVRTPLDPEHPPPSQQSPVAAGTPSTRPGCSKPQPTWEPVTTTAPILTWPLPLGDVALLAGGMTVPCPSGPAQDVPTAPRRARRQLDSRQSPARRSLPAASRGRARARSHRERQARRGDNRGDSGDEETGVCPICSGHFSLDLLPVHASHCGEEDPGAAWPSSLLAPVSPATRVSCPICQRPFGAAEVELHASTCGELGGTPATP